MLNNFKRGRWVWKSRAVVAKFTNYTHFITIHIILLLNMERNVDFSVNIRIKKTLFLPTKFRH